MVLSPITQSTPPLPVKWLLLLNAQHSIFNRAFEFIPAPLVDEFVAAAFLNVIFLNVIFKLVLFKKNNRVLFCPLKIVFSLFSPITVK